MSRYDVEKFEPPPDPELVCCICTFVLDKPMESPCQHVFCKHCIETWLGQRRTCPTCRKKVSKRDLKPVLPLVQNMLNKLTMVCDFNENGCLVKPTLELYQSHIAKCDFELLTCRFSKCQAKILRRDMTQHENELCEFREVLCLRQCGLHIAIRDMDNHDCMLALKKHAEERQKHAEELETRLQQLMSLQQSLREDVETLRRQVEQERQHQPSGDGWSSSSWDSWDDDQNTTGFFESDTDPPVDNSQRSTDSNVSLDQASRDVASDSDLENGRNTRTWRQYLSESSDDLEIVEEVVPNTTNNVVASTSGGGDTAVSEVIEFVNEGEETAVTSGGQNDESANIDSSIATQSTNAETSGVTQSENFETSGETQSVEEGSGNPILTALDVVRDFVDFVVFTQDDMVGDSVDAHFNQNLNIPSIQYLLQQFTDCHVAFSSMSTLNLSSSTWEAVCRFLTDIVSSLLRLRTNQPSWYVASTPISSTPMHSGQTDTASVIQNSISTGLTSSVASSTEIEVFSSTVTAESELSSHNCDNTESTQGRSWSITESSPKISLFAPHSDILSSQRHRIPNSCARNFESRSADILPLTSDVTSTSGIVCADPATSTQSHVFDGGKSVFLQNIESVSKIPGSLTGHAVSDDILDLLSTDDERCSHDFLSCRSDLKEVGGCANTYSHIGEVLPISAVSRSESEQVFDPELTGQSNRVDRTIPSEDSFICISSTDDLEDVEDSGVNEENNKELVPCENTVPKEEKDVILPSNPVVNQRYLPFQREFERAIERQEMRKKRHASSGKDLTNLFEPSIKTRKIIDQARDLLEGIKEELIPNFKQVSKPQGNDTNKTARSRPVSCTITSAVDPVPAYLATRLELNVSRNQYPNLQKKDESSRLHKAPAPESGLRAGQQLESVPARSPGQRRRHTAETSLPECPDVQVPRRTAQLLDECSDESDSSWEPGNSEVELSDDMSLSDEVDTDSSYEVQVPKPLYQIIEEMAEEDEDSDDSWTPS